MKILSNNEIAKLSGGSSYDLCQRINSTKKELEKINSNSRIKTKIYYPAVYCEPVMFQ